MIERKAYTSKRGTTKIKVPESCIKATSYRGIKRSPIDRKKIAQREKIQKRIGKKYGSKKCSTGNIERAGYTREGFKRKSYVRKNGTVVRAANVRKSEVPPTCIKDTGASGKGTKLPVVLERGDLKKYGYDNIRNLSTQKRHQALRMANDNIRNPLSLFRKLNILSTMNKNRDTDLAKIFKDDAYWVRENFGTFGNRVKSSGSKSSKSTKQYKSKKNYTSGSNNKKNSNRKNNQ